MLCTLGHYIKVHAQLYRIFGKGSNHQRVVLAHLLHSPCRVAVIGEHDGNRAADHVLLGAAISQNVCVVFLQPFIGRRDLLLVGGVGIIAKCYQSDGEQVSCTVNGADLSGQLRLDQIVVAGDLFQRAGLGIVNNVDIVHQIRNTVIMNVLGPVGLVQVCLGVRNLGNIQLLKISAVDQGFHVCVAGHDQIIFVTGAGRQFVDGIRIVRHIA